MDGLDVPFVLGLRAGFFRDDPYSNDPLPVQDSAGTAVAPASLALADHWSGHHSPVRRYPWQEACPALRRLMATAPGGTALTRLEYRNPVTGCPALATLGCLLEGLSAEGRTRPRRETASSVIVVARGSGTLSCGRQTFALLPNDVAAIPSWTWHQLIASDHDLVLLRVTDRPIHDAFGLFRAEEAETMTCVSAAQRGVTDMLQRAAVNGVDLEYELCGAGEPVVLIPWGVGAKWAEPLLEQQALTSRYQLLHYHRAGFAGSGPLEDPPTMAAHAAHCHQLMGELGITRAHIVGHSSSVPVALQLALDAPEAVHTLTLMEAARPAPPTDTQQRSAKTSPRPLSSATARATRPGR